MLKRPMRADDLLRLQFVGDPQISPDGSRILFAKKHINDKNAYVTNLFTVDMDGRVQAWTQGEAGAGNGRWSPDGSAIAFVSGREGKQGQIFLLPTTGGEARKLTALPEGAVGGLEWSPDGRYIAFQYRPTAEEWTQKAKAEREAKGLSTPPRVINKEFYRLDGDGYFLDQRFAVYIVDVATGDFRKLYDGDRIGHYSYTWSPDSRELAICHSFAKRPMFDPPEDGIVRVDLEGIVWRLEGLPNGGKSNIKWSPDGKWLAYLGNTHLDGWGCRNQRLWVVPADGKGGRCLTENDDYCLATSTLSDAREVGDDGVIEWSPDSKAIYISVGTRGEVQLGYVSLDKGGVELLTHGPQVLQIGNVSADGERIAAIYGIATRPNEVAVYDLARHAAGPRVLTRFNEDFIEEVKLADPEEISLETPDGTELHGWVMKPVDYLEPRRYPAVLQIHGGPHAQYGWGFFHEMQLLAAEGYVVVYTNPRGSKGYGEDHCMAIKGDWGNKDWQDMETVTRWMQHQPYIHPGQMGVGGGSYGGYMTNWVIGHTTAFAAAVTDRCVSNLVSFGGNSDFIQAKDTYWPGVFYGDITQLWANSPISHFENVSTPTLVIHSEGDLRCNIEQSEQVYAALCQLGVDCRFVRYPVSTFHGMSRNGPPDLRLHRLGENLAWWEKYLKS